MALHIAQQTLDKINHMIEADQGSAYRGWLGRVMPHMDDAYRMGEESFRTHLGASLIGSECARAIWYGWRWTTKPKFEGRILRLFNRGHLEEARFIAMFLMIGCQVFQQDENGKQFRISHAEGHFGGSGDGVAIGLPELPPGQACLLEFKTHADKSFIEVKKKGVREAKFEHFVQMQMYMSKMGLAVALYGAVNKNNDDLHLEYVYLDQAIADQFLHRGELLVWMDTAPTKMSNSPGFFKCKWCDHSPVCHMNKEPNLNCRTCAFSSPVAGAQWVCKKDPITVVLPKEKQFVGCAGYVRHKEI